MRRVVDDIDQEAGKILAELPDGAQEEFFTFSQRLEDNDEDRVAGLGMYLHAILLMATEDREHAIAVLKDSAELHEPLSSAMLADVLAFEDPTASMDAAEVKKLLEVGINDRLSYALELALLGRCRKIFSKKEQEDYRGALSMIHGPDGVGGMRAIAEQGRFFFAASSAREHPTEQSVHIRRYRRRSRSRSPVRRIYFGGGRHYHYRRRRSPPDSDSSDSSSESSRSGSPMNDRRRWSRNRSGSRSGSGSPMNDRRRWMRSRSRSSSESRSPGSPSPREDSDYGSPNPLYRSPPRLATMQGARDPVPLPFPPVFSLSPPLVFPPIDPDEAFSPAYTPASPNYPPSSPPGDASTIPHLRAINMSFRDRGEERARDRVGVLARDRGPFPHPPVLPVPPPLFPPFGPDEASPPAYTPASLKYPPSSPPEDAPVEVIGSWLRATGVEASDSEEEDDDKDKDDDKDGDDDDDGDKDKDDGADKGGGSES